MDTATATWSPASFLGCTARQGRVLLGLGQQLAVLTPPRCPHSHSSVPTSPAASRCSRAPHRTLWGRAGSGLFFHPPKPHTSSKPHMESRQQPRFPLGSLPRGWDPDQTQAAKTAAGRFIPSTGVRWGTAGEMFPLSLSQAPGYKPPLTQLCHPVLLPGEMPQ